MINLMELPRGERLISLYHYLPRGKCNAKSLTELIAVFNPTREKPKSRAKLLENDLLALFSLLDEEAHCTAFQIGQKAQFQAKLQNTILSQSFYWQF